MIRKIEASNFVEWAGGSMEKVYSTIVGRINPAKPNNKLFCHS